LNLDSFTDVTERWTLLTNMPELIIVVIFYKAIERNWTIKTKTLVYQTLLMVASLEV